MKLWLARAVGVGLGALAAWIVLGLITKARDHRVSADDPRTLPRQAAPGWSDSAATPLPGRKEAERSAASRAVASGVAAGRAAKQQGTSPSADPESNSGFSFQGWFDAAKTELSTFDPGVWAVVQENQAAIHSAPGSKECGMQRAARLGKSWVVTTQVSVDAVVKDARLAIADLRFEQPSGRVVDGDEEFRRCFREQITRVSLPCEGCREGSVTFPWPLGQIYNLPAKDPPAGAQGRQ